MTDTKKVLPGILSQAQAQAPLTPADFAGVKNYIFLHGPLSI